MSQGQGDSKGTLALVHLSRDNLQPVYLRGSTGAVDGYAEGNVINTRFGSFPHSTLIGVPWGAQVRASIVDTGSRGRKRKPDSNDVATPETQGTPAVEEEPKAASTGVKTAASGFVHVLAPTPELWTMSLPHRTQVVYTPDYSYILHRIRARPGMRIIEAGAGSGSFTHAAVRAVFNGHPQSEGDHRGKVFSFEFDKARFEKMQEEIEAHNLSDMVHITHRDVYNDGFLVKDGESPEADCIFLDLPAPWKALPHLTRASSKKPQDSEEIDSKTRKSPLRADRSVYLCTFSPCIEQVTKTVEVMRQLGWMDIEMVEVAHKRFNVMRERVGLNMPTERGTNQTAGNVDEALARLREVEDKAREFHGRTQGGGADNDDDEMDVDDTKVAVNVNGENDGGDEGTKPWMLGRLIHRTEAEIKTHTSYLTFAVLPQEWTAEQEAAAFENWPCGREKGVIGSLDKAVRKQEKRDMLAGKKRKKEAAASSKNVSGETSSNNASPAPKKSKASS
ncbi:tRNA methyltransferase complex GCD14 subunit [Microdochium trichocladiopsis]|uniref:tRNA (adenine(58)-N(1))-methyltransferase catalytic subunit TRM61 n=1 Tax=Microdochium trichocladiopsis TaxID=1682393 RepID=A0A9P9BS42_9PEZI|nr:tRNA methyltransferase complex GCD14 subunit [Microdochium trichocladiopsis]KAH7033460.1 tRNA methyltransferase complex GCD14 subunit [Microdochium trichocladiopsis]